MFIISGGGSGIGKALALALAERGKKVLIIGRRESLLREVSSKYLSIDYFSADLSRAEDREAIAEFLENEPSITALINNAGIIDPMLPLKNMGLSDWRKVMATNVEAPLFLTQKLFSKLKGGRVLNIGSGLAHFPAAGLSAYCVSKAALNMLTGCWQLETQEVAISSVMPGIVETHMQDLLRTTREIDQKSHQFYNQLKNMNQLVSAETVAAFLCWLLLDLPVEQYVAEEWDIYDQKHHSSWLTPPHKVPNWSE